MGEAVAIIGQYGSGKSTLMNMPGCLDVPTEGNYGLHGIDVSDMDDDELSDVRNREIGFTIRDGKIVSDMGSSSFNDVYGSDDYHGDGRAYRNRSRSPRRERDMQHRGKLRYGKSRAGNRTVSDTRYYGILFADRNFFRDLSR